MDEYSKLYQSFLFLEDFNASVSEKCLEEFCNSNGLNSLIKKPTCFKNPVKPTCIDLILTNQPSCFQHNKVFETGLSDFHLLTVTEFKMSFQKLPQKIINYRDYKNFNNEKFQSDICKMNLNTTNLEGFMKTVFHIFNPVHDGLFRGCSRMAGGKKAPLPKICHTYPTMMKLGTVIPCPKKIQKIYESRDTPLDFC